MGLDGNLNKKVSVSNLLSEVKVRIAMQEMDFSEMILMTSPFS